MKMNYFQNLNQLNDAVQLYFRNGTITNNYILVKAYEDHITNKKLAFISKENNIVFLLDKYDHYQLYYYLNDFQEILTLPTDKPIVMEILYRGESKLPNEVFRYWQKQGFNNHLTRDNMIADFHKLVIPHEEYGDICIRYAVSDEEVQFAQKLFDAALDKYTGDRLTFNQLKQYSLQNNLLCAYYQGDLSGVLQFEIKNKIVWLGHIAVDEMYRGKGIANELVKRYIVDNKSDQNTRYQLWVIQNNVGAINLYHKFGFDYANKSTASMLKINKN
jgi:GNAT superfamily N-acetyltransferase